MEKRKYYRIKIKNIILIIVVSSLIVFMLWHNNYTSSNVKRIGWTTAMLAKARSDIQKYHNLKEVYPDNLVKLAEYGKENRKSGIRAKLPKEYISDRKGSTTEHGILNGEGGWYYNKATGELRVNLTRHIKDYLKLYFGKERNELPSEW